MLQFSGFYFLMFFWLLQKNNKNPAILNPAQTGNPEEVGVGWGWGKGEQWGWNPLSLFYLFYLSAVEGFVRPSDH